MNCIFEVLSWSKVKLTLHSWHCSSVIHGLVESLFKTAFLFCSTTLWEVVSRVSSQHWWINSDWFMNSFVFFCLSIRINMVGTFCQAMTRKLYHIAWIIRHPVLNELKKNLTNNHDKTIYKQESPPVWTQEAYHPPCSEYSFCCSILAETPPTDWPPPQLADPPHWTDPHSWTDPPPSWTDPPWLDWPPLAGLTPPCLDWPPLAGLNPPTWTDPLWLDWPPPGVNKLTKWNYYLPIVLRTRAVTSQNGIFVLLGIPERFLEILCIGPCNTPV